MALTKIGNLYKPYSVFAVRISLGILFFYYGILALMDPQTQGMLWTASWTRNIITSIISLKAFMLIFGILETIIGAALLIGYRTKEAALTGSFLLVGIILNLYQINIEIMIRDVVILTASLYLWTKGCGNYCLDNIYKK